MEKSCVDKDLDWVILKEDINVCRSGKMYLITKGAICRVLKYNNNETVNVSFGGNKGIHALNPNVLEKI